MSFRNIRIVDRASALNEEPKNKNRAGRSPLRFSISLFAICACTALVLLSSCGLSKKTEQPDSSALYKKADAPVAQRVDDLLSRMTLEEKIGQMTQLEKNSVRSGDVRSFMLGSVLSGGGGSPRPNTVAAWCDMIDGFQKEALSTRLGIPVLYGTDAVHGHNNLRGATIFPHNIGLGAANDPELVERIAAAAAVETAASGAPWTFAPCVALARDPRWGRTYESFSQDSRIVASLGAAFVRGWVAADVGSAALPVATAKHYLGDGGTEWASSRSNNYKLDQGNTIGDDAYLRNELLPPYADALAAGARTVMTSFSSWNGLKMHGHKELVTDILKGELGFSGFVVSDWAGIDQVHPDYYRAVVESVNAGIDMNMVPYDARTYIAAMKKAIEAKDIPLKRIDDAVRRILTVKFESGLFERPFADRTLAARVRAPEHLALAREAVAKSLVLLKNEAVAGTAALPIPADAVRIYVAGSGADDIGLQCGGWTIEWQGRTGDITEGTTLLEALLARYPETEIVYDRSGNFKDADRNALCIVVASEPPYAEGVGDTANLLLPTSERLLVARVSEQFERVALVVYSGRPVVLGELESAASSIVAAWLPGTEGAGVVDVLSGDRSPTGTLPFDWPASVEQLPVGRFISGEQKPLWPVGFGLNW